MRQTFQRHTVALRQAIWRRLSKNSRFRRLVAYDSWLTAFLCLAALFVVSCGLAAIPASKLDVYPTPHLTGPEVQKREVRFLSRGVTLAGELDLPQAPNPPLVFVIHHSGPVMRDAYGYLAELMTEAGFAVFRFDKRGTGASGGSYGCCEAEDMLEAYRAVMNEPGFDRCAVFIVAQSIGTEHAAAAFEQIMSIQPPVGVALLSNLLSPDDITGISVPVRILVSDSEPNLSEIGIKAAEAHNRMYGLDAGVYVAEATEHTLFDTSTGPIDWSDPAWVTRYHRGAMSNLVEWIQERAASSKDCAS
jgi:pimeloyl-ACP methyl ester carboxylesterase